MTPSKRTIHYLSVESVMDSIAKDLLDAIHKLPISKRYMGFAVTTGLTRHACKREVGLIQLATATDVYLFHVRNMRALPQHLSYLLTSYYVHLMGFNCSSDLEALKTSFFIDTRAVDMRSIISLSQGIIAEQLSLGRLAEDFCGYVITPVTPGDVLNVSDQVLPPKIREHFADQASVCYDLWCYHMSSTQEPLPGKSEFPEYVLTPEESAKALKWLGCRRFVNPSIGSVAEQLWNEYPPWQNRGIRFDMEKYTQHVAKEYLEAWEKLYERPVSASPLIPPKSTPTPTLSPPVVEFAQFLLKTILVEPRDNSAPIKPVAQPPTPKEEADKQRQDMLKGLVGNLLGNEIAPEGNPLAPLMQILANAMAQRQN